MNLSEFFKRPDNPNHCSDVLADRHWGEEVENEFIRLCLREGFVAHRMQENRNKFGAKIHILINGKDNFVVAPDIALWGRDENGTRDRSTLHEIKAKYPTMSGEFGLEEYRLRGIFLINRIVRIFYTIKVVVRDGIPNTEKGKWAILKYCPEWSGTWITCSFDDLFAHGGRTAIFPSYVGGRKENEVMQFFWPISLWRPIPFRRIP